MSAQIADEETAAIVFVRGENIDTFLFRARLVRGDDSSAALTHSLRILLMGLREKQMNRFCFECRQLADESSALCGAHRCRAEETAADRARGALSTLKMAEMVAIATPVLAADADIEREPLPRHKDPHKM